MKWQFLQLKSIHMCLVFRHTMCTLLWCNREFFYEFT